MGGSWEEEEKGEEEPPESGLQEEEEEEEEKIATKTLTFLQLSLRSRGQRSLNTLSCGEALKCRKRKEAQEEKGNPLVAVVHFLSPAPSIHIPKEPFE